MNYVEKIAKLKPCEEGRKFLAQYDNEQDAWNNCKNPEYKLWYIDKTSGEIDSPSRKKLVKTLLDIVSLCKPCEDKEVEQLRQELIKVGYDYCNDKATLEELKTARSKLYDASYDAYTASYAAYTASYAAYTAYTADVVYAAKIAGVTKEKQLTIIHQNYPTPPEL